MLSLVRLSVCLSHGWISQKLFYDYEIFTIRQPSASGFCGVSFIQKF